MRARWPVFILFGLLTIAIRSAFAAAEDKKADPRVFELRTYTTYPGKMPALLARFKNHTNHLLEKHGMTLIGFWTPTDGKNAENTLVYLVAHPSREAADKNWKEFGGDPDWKSAREASEKDGKIVEKVDRVFLKPTDFSGLR